MVTVLCMVQKFKSSIITTMTLYFESDLGLLVSIGGVPACKFCEVVKECFLKLESCSIRCGRACLKAQRELRKLLDI